MEKLQAFQAAASEGGFVATGESDEGTVLWLKKATVEAEDRICLDSLTNSATVYWATIPWKINSSAEVHVSTKCDRFRRSCFIPQAHE